MELKHKKKYLHYSSFNFANFYLFLKSLFIHEEELDVAYVYA